MLDNNTPVAVWCLAAFLGSCVGLGFAAGYLARRRGWGTWTIGLASTCVALLWPIIVLAAFLLTSSRGPCEPPCDAPVYVFTGIVTIVMPLLFVLSFVLALSGAFVAWRRFRPDTPPNKSLDASGTSGLVSDNVSITWLLPAASTQTLCGFSEFQNARSQTSRNCVCDSLGSFIRKIHRRGSTRSRLCV
jgi:hypothetical protein